MADITIDAADVLQTAGTKRGISAAVITAGQIITNDSNGQKILADASDNTKISDLGMAVCSAPNIGQPILWVKLDSALEIGVTVANGKGLWLSETAGSLCDDEADITSIGATHVLLGCGKGGTAINFDATSPLQGTEIT
jgi:hypothetical protein